MDTEFEAKFYSVDKDDLRVKLRKLGAVLASPERLMRRVIYDKKFHPEFSCHFVRIRDEGGKVTLTAKTHTQTGLMADEKEIEIEVSDYDKVVQIFSRINLQPDRYQETLRESWELGRVKIDIDTWPGLDPYCEIESDSEDRIKSVAQKLGFSWVDHLVTNPMDMLADVYQMDVKEVLAKAAHLTFENNPFAKFSKTGIIRSVSKSV